MNQAATVENVTTTVEKLPHHEQLEYCLTRPKYRQGRDLTSVKVYTVNDESKYLLLTGIPAIKIDAELERLCCSYGNLEVLQHLPDYPHEDFTEVYMAKYCNIKNARFAKVKLDGKSFYGGVLHVCYAPEQECVEETREKLVERRKSIAALTRYKQDASEINKTKKLDKRQIQSAATKRYLSRLKEDVSCLYSKHFASKGESNISEIADIETDDTNPLCNSSTSCGSQSLQSSGSVLMETRLEDVSTNVSQCEDSNRSKNSVVVCQKRPSYGVPQSKTSKKIKVFKNAKILSFHCKDKMSK